MGIRLGCAVRYFLEVGDWHGAKFFRKNVDATEKSGAESSAVRIESIKQVESSLVKFYSAVKW